MPSLCKLMVVEQDVVDEARKIGRRRRTRQAENWGLIREWARRRREGGKQATRLYRMPASSLPKGVRRRAAVLRPPLDNAGRWRHRSSKNQATPPRTAANALFHSKPLSSYSHHLLTSHSCPLSPSEHIYRCVSVLSPNSAALRSRIPLPTVDSIRCPFFTTPDNMTDYFPRTPSEDQGYHSEEMSNQIVPNGAAPPSDEPTKTKGMPNKMSLKLSHLPSRKDIKPPYPRTPSSVRILIIHLTTHLASYPHETRMFRTIHAAFQSML